MALINASDVTLATAETGTAVVIAHATSASLSISREMRDSTTKDSAAWAANLPALKSWELSGDGFIEVGSTNGQATLFDNLADGDALTVVFAVGAETYSGTAYLTSLSMEGGVEDNATYSVSLTGTAALTKA